jgi:hypothetical protein
MSDLRTVIGNVVAALVLGMFAVLASAAVVIVIFIIYTGLGCNERKRRRDEQD